MPSDGGLYSCMAVSASGNASRDAAIHSKNERVACVGDKVRMCRCFIFLHSYLASCSPAWSSSPPVGLTWAHVNRLLAQDSPGQRRDAHHSVRSAVEAERRRAVERGQSASFRYDITGALLKSSQRMSLNPKHALFISAGPLVIASLKPYTSYTVRLAALNAVGLGQFSDTYDVHTQGIRK